MTNWKEEGKKFHMKLAGNSLIRSFDLSRGIEIIISPFKGLQELSGIFTTTNNLFMKRQKENITQVGDMEAAIETWKEIVSNEPEFMCNADFKHNGGIVFSYVEEALRQFVHYYNHQRYHESLNNLTPADVYYGRGDAILKERERIKQMTLNRRESGYFLQKLTLIT